MRSRADGGPARALVTAVTTAVLYLAAARYVGTLNAPSNLGAAFWPGTGITLTALLLTRTRWWPAILLAVGLVELGNDLAVGYDATASLWWALANTVAPLLAARLVRRLRAEGLATVRDITAFVAAAVVLGPLAGALLGAAGIEADGAVRSFAGNALRWAIRDALGVLAITPASLLLLGDREARRTLARPEGLVMLVAVAVVSPLVFYLAPGDLTEPYLIVPFLLWAAIRFHVVGAAVSTAIAAISITAATGLGFGSFAEEGTGRAIMSLQQYLATVTVTLLVVGARTQESIGHQRVAENEQRRADLEHQLVTALSERDASSQLVRLLLESTGQGLYGMDLEGRCTFANPSCAALLGYDDPADLRGRVMHDLIHHTRPDGTPYPVQECLVHRALREHTGVHCEDEVLFRRDGTSFPAEYRSHTVEQGGEVIGAVVTFADVTTARESQQRMRDSEARFRGLFEAANIGIAMSTADGRFIAANPFLCAMLGYDEAEMLQMGFADLTHPDDLDASRTSFGRLFSGEVAEYRVEKRYLHKDGHTVWGDLSLALIRDQDGTPRHTVATVEDITARRQAEGRLQRSQSLQRVAGALAHVGGWSIALPARTVTWSDELYRILDHSPESSLELDTGMARYAPEHRDRMVAAVEACASEGTPFDLEAQIETFTGRWLWVRVVAEAERSADGSVVRVLGALQDITEQHRAAVEAEALGERLRATVESITDAFFTLDRDWRFTYVNHRAEALLQRPRDELLGRDVWEAFPDAVGTEADHAYHRAMEGGTTEVIEEYPYPALDAWFAVRAYPSAHGLAVYFQDITERRRDRQALEERESRLAEQAALLDEARDAILVRDLEHRVTYWNRSAELLYGWSAEEVIGERTRELLHRDPAIFDEATAELLVNGEWHGELVQAHRSGRDLVVESRWTLVRDDAGQPRSVLVIDTDISERKQLESQLLRAQRMESIGTLAGGLAHDLNNVLTPIMMSTGLLQSGETDELRLAMLETITSSTTRAADMVRQILSFARGVEGRRVHVDVAELLREVRQIAEDTFLKTVRVVLIEPTDLWPVVGDPTQLHQVLINLCVNARDAMPDGGTLHLAADAVVVDEQYAGLSQGAAPGRYVRIRVEDDGEGMAPEVLDRIFDPFYTTKAQGHGTGLGLSISTGIVNSHGGFMRVYSEPGQGTRFLVHLPATLEGEADALLTDTSALPEGRGETVLVVDDEEEIRRILRQTLEGFRYRVLEASSGGEAVELVGDGTQHVDVILTDMMMPGMDGPATIRALREVRPDIPLIAASGLHAQVDVSRAVELGVRHFLPKPFSIRTMLHTLHDILAAPGERRD